MISAIFPPYFRHISAIFPPYFRHILSGGNEDRLSLPLNAPRAILDLGIVKFKVANIPRVRIASIESAISNDLGFADSLSGLAFGEFSPLTSVTLSPIGFSI